MCAEALLEGKKADFVIADKAYDSNNTLNQIGGNIGTIFIIILSNTAWWIRHWTGHTAHFTIGWEKGFMKKHGRQQSLFIFPEWIRQNRFLLVDYAPDGANPCDQHGRY